jgi:hypothetical protein
MLNPDRGSSLRLRLSRTVIRDGKFWSVGTLDVVREESLDSKEYRETTKCINPKQESKKLYVLGQMCKQS